MNSLRVGTGNNRETSLLIGWGEGFLAGFALLIRAGRERRAVPLKSNRSIDRLSQLKSNFGSPRPKSEALRHRPICAPSSIFTNC